MPPNLVSASQADPTKEAAMVGQCRQFVQNAWRRDLCANCFKSRDEHATKDAATATPAKERAQPPCAAVAVQSILKGSGRGRAGGSSVRFPTAGEESQVIGVGGLECLCSEDEDDDDAPFDEAELAAELAALEAEDEEERALQRLTRSNTDYNTVSGKVQLMQLPLGRPRTDAEGRKHTPLVVCVTPFGGACGPDRDETDGDQEKPYENIAIPASSRIPVLKGRATSTEQSVSVISKTEKESFSKSAVTGISVSEGEKASDLKLNEKEITTSVGMGDKFLHSEPINASPIEQIGNKGDEAACTEKLTTSFSSENKPDIVNNCTPAIDEVSIDTDNAPVTHEVTVNGNAEVDISNKETNDDVEVVSPVTEVVTDKNMGKPPAVEIHTEENSSTTVKKEVSKQHSSEVSKSVTTETKFSKKSSDLPMKLNGSPYKYTTSSSLFSTRAHEISSTLLKCEWKGKATELPSTKDKSLAIESYKSLQSAEKTFQKMEDAVSKPNSDIYKSSIGKNLFAMRGREINRPTQDHRKLGNTNEAVNMKDKPVTVEIKKLSEVEVTSSTNTCSIPDQEREQPDGRAEDPEEEPPLSPAIAIAAPRPSFLHGVKPRLPQKPSSLFMQQSPLRGQKQADQTQAPQPVTCQQQKQAQHQQQQEEQQKQQPQPRQQQQQQQAQLPPQQQQPQQQQHQLSLQSQEQTLQARPVEEPVTLMSAVAPSLMCAMATDGRSPHKRQAPRPPSSSVSISSNSSSSSNNSTDSQHHHHHQQGQIGDTSTQEVKGTAREALSDDTSPPCSVTDSVTETSASSVGSQAPTPVTAADKKKGRFSLRKFLRLSSGHHQNKDGDSKNVVGESLTVVIPTEPDDSEARVKTRPQLRPRLEIVHPFSLDGAAVEVVRSPAPLPQSQPQSQPQSPQMSASMVSLSASTDNLTSTDSEILATDSSSSVEADSPNHSPTGRPIRPPPPPRSQHGRNSDATANKPVRPPPPRSAELLRQQKLPPPAVALTRPSPQDTLYANLAPVLGEVRLGLTPDKPQRTASMRDAGCEMPKRKSASEDSGYESVEMADGRIVTQTQQVNNDFIYEHMNRGRSSSPESCNKKSTRRCNSPRRRSDGSLDDCSCVKARPGYVRSSSYTYCAFETDSDTYSPYSFYFEEGDDDDADWISSGGHSCRNSHLRLRKGRSVIHESLEDNYGAVTVANHEALAQVLEQVKHSSALTIPVALRGLKTVPELHWCDFSVDERGRTLAGRRAFYPALWSGHPVTLSVSAAGRGGGDLPASRAPMLTPLAQFCDLIPARYLLRPPSVDPDQLVRASVSVLVRLQVDTVQSYGRRLREKERWEEEAASFALLQLVNGLKRLQAQGIEESPLSLTNFVLCRYEDCQQADVHPHLCALRELGASTAEGGGGTAPRGSLCRCALVGLRHLHPAAIATQRTSLLTDILTRGQAASLSQAKSVLELWLWGPADAALTGSRLDREQALQRWLDLERATALHELALVPTRPHHHLTTFEESRLLFLVTTSAEILTDASFLLDGSSTITSDA